MSASASTRLRALVLVMLGAAMGALVASVVWLSAGDRSERTGSGTIAFNESWHGEVPSVLKFSVYANLTDERADYRAAERLARLLVRYDPITREISWVPGLADSRKVTVGSGDGESAWSLTADFVGISQLNGVEIRYPANSSNLPLAQFAAGFRCGDDTNLIEQRAIAMAAVLSYVEPLAIARVQEHTSNRWVVSIVGDVSSRNVILDEHARCVEFAIRP